MNAQSQHGSEMTASSAPPVTAESTMQPADDGMLNTTFNHGHEKQPEAAVKLESSVAMPAEATPEYVPFYQRFAEHLGTLKPISRFGGIAFAGMAVAELLLGATCTVAGGPVSHLAFAGLNALLSTYYLSGTYERVMAK